MLQKISYITNYVLFGLICVIGCNIRNNYDDNKPTPKPTPVPSIVVVDPIVPKIDIEKPKPVVPSVENKVYTDTKFAAKVAGEKYIAAISDNFKSVSDKKYDTLSQAMDELVKLNVAARVQLTADLVILTKQLTTEDDKYESDKAKVVLSAISDGLNEVNKE